MIWQSLRIVVNFWYPIVNLIQLKEYTWPGNVVAKVVVSCTWREAGEVNAADLVVLWWMFKATVHLILLLKILVRVIFQKT